MSRKDDIDKIVMFGPFKDPTGYGHVIRGFARQFFLNGWLVGLMDFPEWSGRSIPLENPVYEQMERMLPVIDSSVTLNFCLPTQTRTRTSKNQIVPTDRVMINYTMFESDRISKEWVLYSSLSDKIFLPTEFCREAWLNSGVNRNRIAVVPIGTDTELYNPGVETQKLGTDEFLIEERYPYRFMNIQEVSDRKNIDALLRAWIVATKHRHDACLILKIASYTENRMDYLTVRIDNIRKSLGIREDEHAPIFVYGMILSNSEMASFMNVATHYITTSRGEGWDMSAASMAAMGKQLIVPNHTAYPEYLKDVRCVACNKVPAHQGGQLSYLYEGSNWFEVEHDDVVAAIREALNGQKYPSLRQHMVDNYSWPVVAKKMQYELRMMHDTGSKKLAISAVLPKRQKENCIPMMACRSFGTQCGIAEYGDALYDEIVKVVPSAGRMGGDDAQWMDHIDNNKVNILHIQHEYQFHSPSRLAYILKQARRRNIPTIITQHTLSDRASDHNDVIRSLADVVLVHSDYNKIYAENVLKYNNVQVVPMPVKPLFDRSQIATFDPKTLPPKDRFKIGFFGFAYFHKGIDTIIHKICSNSNFNNDLMLFFSTKPKQDIYGYYDQCRAMLNQYKKIDKRDYWWFDQYATEDEIVKYLSICDMIVMPYKEYGSVGSSAAISLVLRAGVPTLVSDTCWFKHVPSFKNLTLSDAKRNQPVVFSSPSIDIEGFRKFVIENKEFFSNDWQNQLSVFANRNSFTKAAEFHTERIYNIK